MMEYDSGDPAGCLDKALEVADWKGFAKRKADSASRGKLRGIGLCTYVEACGLAPSRIATRLGCARRPVRERHGSACIPPVT
jgi:carbon-monoxide dehydrogenase large subunit